LVNSNATVAGRLAKAIDAEGQKPALPADPGNCAVSRLPDIDEVGAKRLVVLCVLAR
tara:strand:+ start:227 stop:397 length:171 start_codon:yes stop_codon:yes gene_type:complete